jgi:hypothetical protein
VAVCEGQLLLVDLTCSQANHPEIDVPVEGFLVAPVDANWARGHAELVLQEESGIYSRYRAIPDDRWYTINSPDWNLISDAHLEILEAILIRMLGHKPMYEVLPMMHAGRRV